MDWAWIIAVSVLLAYTIRILSYFYGWIIAVRSGAREKSKAGGTASIIIPVRNEADRIRALLADLQNQQFPANQYEVIVVNDHSTDLTADVVRSIDSGRSNMRLLELDEGEYGKKAAIRKGVQAAKHEIIVSTDGDCRAGENWLARLMSAMGEEGVRMVAGPVIIEPDRDCFRALQSIELLSLVGVSAGAAGLASPVMCNAANLACRRKDYLQYLETGPPGSASGDDMFLMLWLKKRHPGAMRYLTDPETVIRTIPQNSLARFAMQRLRWASKSRYYRDVHLVTTTGLVFLANAFLLLSALLCFVDTRWTYLFLFQWAVKTMIDGLFMYRVLKHFGKRKLMLLLLPLELVYFMYVSVVGIASQILPFNWKGRNIQP